MTDTNLIIRVIAKGGKFLGDDIGGALISIRDTETGEILASGVTQGDSGPNEYPNKIPAVMCTLRKRGDTIPMATDGTNDTTAKFTATLQKLDRPKKIEVSAYGPLGCQGSANTTTVTTWVYPGVDMTAGNGILLELQGLLCTIISPATHGKQTAETDLVLTANVAMMCGCPISDKPPKPLICCGDTQPWAPSDFVVNASITSAALSTPLSATMTCNGPDASIYTCTFPGSNFPTPAKPTVYKVRVVAQQISSGMVGADYTTFLVPPPSS